MVTGRGQRSEAWKDPSSLVQLHCAGDRLVSPSFAHAAASGCGRPSVPCLHLWPWGVRVCAPHPHPKPLSSGRDHSVLPWKRRQHWPPHSAGPGATSHGRMQHRVDRVPGLWAERGRPHGGLCLPDAPPPPQGHVPQGPWAGPVFPSSGTGPCATTARRGSVSGVH